MESRRPIRKGRIHFYCWSDRRKSLAVGSVLRSCSESDHFVKTSVQVEHWWAVRPRRHFSGAWEGFSGRFQGPGISTMCTKKKTDFSFEEARDSGENRIFRRRQFHESDHLGAANINSAAAIIQNVPHSRCPRAVSVISHN